MQTSSDKDLMIGYNDFSPAFLSKFNRMLNVLSVVSIVIAMYLARGVTWLPCKPHVPPDRSPLRRQQHGTLFLFIKGSRCEFLMNKIWVLPLCRMLKHLSG